MSARDKGGLMVGESNSRNRGAARNRPPAVGPMLVEFPERTTPDFGQLLRRHRLRAGLSQATLAERASLSERAISDLERGLKARPQATTIGLLAAALDLGSAEREQLVAAARRAAPAQPLAPPAPAIAPLPLPPTPLIGRDEAIAAATAILDNANGTLLTITGPGGIGKSQFALALGRQLHQRYRDGVLFVALADLSDVQAVPTAIGQVLGLVAPELRPDEERIAAFLRGRRMLLILDNFEHLLGAAVTVEYLLARCPELTIIVTSRAPLRLRREREFPLPPLALPTASDMATVASAAAVQLLTARARAIRADFAVTAANAATLAAICARLDGLPLALELAAARLRVLEPAALLTGLTSRTVALRSTAPDLPERHQTLQRTIAWSYDLLSPGEQRLFRCLGIFHGGATLAALAAVAGATHDDALDGADTLVAHSLVRAMATESGTTRLMPLETLREFALARLVERGEEISARNALVAHLLALLAGADDGVIGPERAHWHAILGAEEANVRAALAHAAALGDAGAGLPLCWAIWRFWFDRGQGAEARSWLDRFVALDGPAEWQARCLFAGGLIAVWQFDRAAAERYLRACLALANEHGFWRWQAAAVTQLGHAARQAGEMQAAAGHYAEALALRRQYGDQREIALSLLGLGYTLADLGELAEAEGQLTEALALMRAWGDASEEANTLSYLAEIASKRGKVREAQDYIRAGLDRWWEIGASGRILARLGGLASSCADDTPTEALRLLSALHTLADHLRILPASSVGARQVALVATLRERLGAAAADAAWAEGDTADPGAITVLAVAMLVRRAERHACHDRD